MIDPFTAFAMAQGAVKGIKSAMQLGKDINGLYNDFSQFFQAADAVKFRRGEHGEGEQVGAPALAGEHRLGDGIHGVGGSEGLAFRRPPACQSISRFVAGHPHGDGGHFSAAICGC